MRIRPIVTAWSIACLVGCGPSEREIAAHAADSIVALADGGGRVLRATVGGRNLALMVHDCVVYDLTDVPRRDGQRPAILEPDSYLWPTICDRQSIGADSAWATVTLGRTAFGAGGCCATGGTYRTRDGRLWEREGPGGRWTAVRRDSTR